MSLKRGQRPDVTQEVRSEWDAHEAKLEQRRQPLLKGLTSKYDLKLFQEAQSKACEELVSSFACLYEVVNWFNCDLLP